MPNDLQYYHPLQPLPQVQAASFLLRIFWCHVRGSLLKRTYSFLESPSLSKFEYSLGFRLTCVGQCGGGERPCMLFSLAVGKVDKENKKEVVSSNQLTWRKTIHTSIAKNMGSFIIYNDLYKYSYL